MCSGVKTKNTLLCNPHFGKSSGLPTPGLIALTYAGDGDVRMPFGDFSCETTGDMSLDIDNNGNAKLVSIGPCLTALHSKCVVETDQKCQHDFFGTLGSDHDITFSTCENGQYQAQGTAQFKSVGDTYSGELNCMLEPGKIHVSVKFELPGK